MSSDVITAFASDLRSTYGDVLDFTPFIPFPLRQGPAAALWEKHLASPLAALTEANDATGIDNLKVGVLRTLRTFVLETAALEEGGVHDRDVPLYDELLFRLDYVLAFSQLAGDDRWPYALLDDVFGVLTVQGCEAVFAFLEMRSDILNLPLAPALERTTGLALLRACNQLLSRLSKSQDAVFCGRILGFMASAFSLGARSGVNLRGDFNVGNETTYEEWPLSRSEDASVKEEVKPSVEDVEMTAVEEEKEGPMDGVNKTVEDGEEEEGALKDEVEEGEEAATSTTKAGETKQGTAGATPAPTGASKPLPLEAFYTTFWSLQTIFANPSLLLTSSAPLSSTSQYAWPTFRTKAERVINTLAAETEKEKILRGSGNEDSPSSFEGLGGGSLGKGELDDVFMPKFLTSPGLLDFELSDVSFRRQILVQFLILFQYLRQSTNSAPTTVTSKKLPEFKADKDIVAWLVKAHDKIVKELRATYPGGEAFVATVLSIVKREENWTRWKDAGCPPFDLSPIADETLVAIATKRRRLEAAPAPKIMFPVGTPALTKLWQTSHLSSLDQLATPKPLPTLASFDARIKREEVELSKRKRAYEKANGPGSLPADDEEIAAIEERKSSLTFRALRLATCDRLHLFAGIKPTNARPEAHGHYVAILLEEEKREREREAAAAKAPALVPVQEVKSALVQEVKVEETGENAKVEKEKGDTEETKASGTDAPVSSAIVEEEPAKTTAEEQASQGKALAEAQVGVEEPKPDFEMAEVGDEREGPAVDASETGA